MGSIPERSGFDLIGRQGHPAALPTPPPSRPQGPTGRLSRGPRWRRLRRQASEIAATVTAFEAKTRFGELLERVSRGEEVVITRHDKPVARLVPEGAPRVDEVRRSVAGLRELQQQIRRRSKATLSDREARSAIDRGRL